MVDTSKLYRIPKKVELPFGYTVQIELLTNKAFKAKHGTLLDGIFDPETRTISIRVQLPLKRRRYILGHELDHAVNDWRHWYGDEGISAQ